MIPLTVIGGYLGAGKTTLINQLLTGERGRRLGVLVNDFGDINIDVDLIAQHDGETLALTNGCVCCNIRDDLGAALESLRSRMFSPSGRSPSRRSSRSTCRRRSATCCA